MSEGNLHQVIEKYRLAAACWDIIGQPYDHVRALMGLGYALLHTGDVNDAQAAFSQALAIIEMLAVQLEEEAQKTAFLRSPLVQEIRAGLEYRA